MSRVVWSLIVVVGLALPAKPAGQSAAGTSSARSAKPRVVITADPELDDVNTLIRALLYSTDVTIEGLVYASSQFHWKGDGKGTTFSAPGREYTRFGLNLCPCTSWRWAPDERFIDDALDAYAKVYPNLKIHNPNYPPPAQLTSTVRWGNVEFEAITPRTLPDRISSRRCCSTIGQGRSSSPRRVDRARSRGRSSPSRIDTGQRPTGPPSASACRASS
jgi:hypothetical protein